MLQNNHHVVAPSVVLTDPADDNSCKVHEHPAWHVVVKTMKPNDLITFIMEEAKHHIINDECMRDAESMLTALGKGQKTGKQCSNKGKEKSMFSVTCENCKSSGHTKANCLVKGRGKESQGPGGQNSIKGEKKWK